MRSKKRAQEDIWLVGFTVPWLNGIEHMSGLVDVLDVQINPKHHAAIFVVRNLDQSGILFKEGLLRATKVSSWNGAKQDWVTDCPVPSSSFEDALSH